MELHAIGIDLNSEVWAQPGPLESVPESSIDKHA